MSWKDKLRDLPADKRDEFEERAAIREILGGQSRTSAEFEAFRDIIREVRRA